MKKILSTILFLAAMVGGKAMAQDCNAILAPYIVLNNIDTNSYPIEKLEYFCQLSSAHFYITDRTPKRAKVFEISELKDYLTGQNLPQNVDIDLNNLSYYRYNFYDFQRLDFKNTVYFRIGKRSENRFLAVRSEIEASQRVNNPEKFND